MSELKALIESGRTGTVHIGELRVRQFANGVLNVANKQESLTQPELDIFRAALLDAGYRDHESWMASQGTSWLSRGMDAGVSVRIKETT